MGWSKCALRVMTRHGGAAAIRGTKHVPNDEE